MNRRISGHGSPANPEGLYLVTTRWIRVIPLLAAIVLGSGAWAFDTSWDALTPRVLKTPEAVELPRNPFHNTSTPIASKSASRTDPRPATKALASVARSRIQGVVRAADGSAVLVWGNRLYSPGQTVSWTDEAAAAELVVQLKSIGARTVAFVVRRTAEPDAAPTDLVIPLPGFFSAP